MSQVRTDSVMAKLAQEKAREHRHEKRRNPTPYKYHLGLAPLSRTHLKRPIMAVEECHAKKKKILGGVQT